MVLKVCQHGCLEPPTGPEALWPSQTHFFDDYQGEISRAVAHWLRACACLNATHYRHMDWLRIACIVTLITHPLHLRICSARPCGTSTLIKISSHETWTLLHQLLCVLVPLGSNFPAVRMWHCVDCVLAILWSELAVLRKKRFLWWLNVHQSYIITTTEQLKKAKSSDWRGSRRE